MERVRLEKARQPPTDLRDQRPVECARRQVGPTDARMKDLVAQVSALGSAHRRGMGVIQAQGRESRGDRLVDAAESDQMKVSLELGGSAVMRRKSRRLRVRQLDRVTQVNLGQVVTGARVIGLIGDGALGQIEHHRHCSRRRDFVSDLSER